MAEKTQPRVDFMVTIGGKTYGAAMPTIRQQIAIASRLEYFCGGNYGYMTVSVSDDQRIAAQLARQVVDLEIYIVQAPPGEEIPKWSELVDMKIVNDAWEALHHALKEHRFPGEGEGKRPSTD